MWAEISWVVLLLDLARFSYVCGQLAVDGLTYILVDGWLLAGAWG